MNHAFFVGGPLDGERVHESHLNNGPRITVPIPARVRAYWTRDAELSPTHVTTYEYREAPLLRVGDRHTFRLFIGEEYGYGDTLDALAQMLCEAMDARLDARRRKESRQ